MTQPDFQRLAHELCQHADLAAPAPDQTVLDLEVKGINFSLYDAGARTPDVAVIYCDFGAVPTQSRDRILLRLLETNLYLFGPHSPTFTCNPETGHVLLAAMLPITSASAAATLDLLAGLADMAMEWRTRYFLTALEHDGAPGAATRQVANSTAGRMAQRFSRPA